MADVELLAPLFDCSREEFRELYNRLAATLGDGDFLFATLGEADNVKAFELALGVAQEQGWLNNFTEIALREGLIRDGSTDTVFELQGLTNPIAGFGEAAEAGPRVAEAYDRVCAVLIDGQPKGTGFLVGPQTILTAWHVIRSLLHDTGEPTEGSQNRLTVNFDSSFHMTRDSEPFDVVEDWLDIAKPCASFEKPGATEAQIALGTPEEDELDFALIRLNGLPGKVRGYYSLSRSVALKPGEKLFVFQHPRGSSQKFDTAAATSFRDESTKMRIYHDANSLDGSSGGLCLNNRFQPVALHQFGLFDSHGKVIKNGAVPTAKIAPFMGTAENIDPDQFQLHALPNGNHPVVGRKEFQRSVWDVAMGKKRILQIWGGERTGKTFSTRILKAILPEGDHFVIEMSAAEIPLTDHQLASLILEKISGPSDDNNGLPTPDNSMTNDSAWREENLFPAFGLELMRVAQDRTIWLVLDQLKKFTLSDAGSRRFLELLYREIRQIPQLRIILIDLKGRVPAADVNDVVKEGLSTVEIEEIATYLGLSFNANELNGAREELGRMSKLIQQAAENSSDEQLPAIADFMIHTVKPALGMD